MVCGFVKSNWIQAFSPCGALGKGAAVYMSPSVSAAIAALKVEPSLASNSSLSLQHAQYFQPFQHKLKLVTRQGRQSNSELSRSRRKRPLKRVSLI